MAEVAGIILAILPLLISAAEHYDNVFRPFRRWRKYTSELELFQRQLGTQRTIFRNECRLLLTILTNSQIAREMMKEAAHPLWKDQDLEGKLIKQLGDSGIACSDIINMLQQKLDEVEKKTTSFGLLIQQSIPVSQYDCSRASPHSNIWNDS